MSTSVGSTPTRESPFCHSFLWLPSLVRRSSLTYSLCRRQLCIAEHRQQSTSTNGPVTLHRIWHCFVMHLDTSADRLEMSGKASFCRKPRRPLERLYQLAVCDVATRPSAPHHHPPFTWTPIAELYARSLVAESALSFDVIALMCFVGTLLSCYILPHAKRSHDV